MKIWKYGNVEMKEYYTNKTNVVPTPAKLARELVPAERVINVEM
ncbi:hypothetical protein NIASO_07420 [Niabella soli DSM 19437]|uniref:Uncharacterized protein n=1 Tax=Niabella soli DSM 19437 TaxID=929713 RepID=W0F7J1_9BACT|nr:hypothetical protein NIASO_07420 [Niabella soli DSM 19437]